MTRTALAALFLAGPAFAADTGQFENQLRKPNEKNEAAEARAVTPPSCQGDDCPNYLYLLLLPVFPYVLVNDLPHSGFLEFPYAASSEAAFGAGAHTPLESLDASYQRVSSAIGGLGARYRLISENRIGFDSSWTRYRQRYNRVDLNLFNADATGTFYQDGPLLGFFGLGLVGLSGQRTNWSPEARFGGDWFPVKPLTVQVSYAIGLIHGNGFNDLRAGLGAQLSRVQVRLGYRALFGPTSHLSGPEVSAAFWF